MWKFFSCLRGTHTYQVRVQPGQVFLECTCCRRRTRGWNLAAVSNRKAPETFRLLLDESVGARRAEARQPSASGARSALLSASAEFRLHLESPGAGRALADRDGSLSRVLHPRLASQPILTVGTTRKIVNALTRLTP
jgi:hypothetical protein